MPSFHSGWTETPSLNSLLHRNPVTAELRFLVPIQWEPKDGLNEFTLCLSQTPRSPNIKLNALNSASARCWWFALFHLPWVSAMNTISPSINLSFLLPFLNAIFPFTFCWLNSSHRINVREEENILWAKIRQDRSDSKQGSSLPWASHTFPLMWREWHCWQNICGEHRLPHVLSPQRQRQPRCY